MAGGILVTLYNNFREERPQEIFAVVWALVILFSTWQHVRYEYYLAVVIALLSAVCIHFVFEKGWGDLRQLATGIMPPATADGSKDAEKAEPHRGKKKEAEKGNRQFSKTGLSCPDGCGDCIRPRFPLCFHLGFL